MIALLCQTNALVSEAQDQDLKALPTGDVERLRTRYDHSFKSLVLTFQGQPPMPQLE